MLNLVLELFFLDIHLFHLRLYLGLEEILILSLILVRLLFELVSELLFVVREVIKLILVVLGVGRVVARIILRNLAQVFELEFLGRGQTAFLTLLELYTRIVPCREEAVLVTPALGAPEKAAALRAADQAITPPVRQLRKRPLLLRVLFLLESHLFLVALGRAEIYLHRAPRTPLLVIHQHLRCT